MQNKIKLSIIGSIILLGLFAQGKIYVTPQVFAFVPSYKGVDSVNRKQTILKPRNFNRKDFLVGFNLAYYNAPISVSAGIEQAVYSTGFYEQSNIYAGKNGGSLSGLNLINYYLEFKYDLWKYNKKLPKKWLTENSKNQYLIVSKISPYIGIDYLRTNKNILGTDNFVIGGRQIGNTTIFDVLGIVDFYPNSRNHFGIRTGLDWTFYNGEKRKFILTFGYKFGFKNLGYHRYHFENPARGVDFYYQTTTNGNGFSIKAGFPIKLFEINKKKITK
jgi:hypothetical protein